MNISDPFEIFILNCRDVLITKGPSMEKVLAAMGDSSPSHLAAAFPTGKEGVCFDVKWVESGRFKYMTINVTPRTLSRDHTRVGYVILGKAFFDGKVADIQLMYNPCTVEESKGYLISGRFCNTHEVKALCSEKLFLGFESQRMPLIDEDCTDPFADDSWPLQTAAAGQGAKS